MATASFDMGSANFPKGLFEVRAIDLVLLRTLTSWNNTCAFSGRARELLAYLVEEKDALGDFGFSKS